MYMDRYAEGFAWLVQNVIDVNHMAAGDRKIWVVPSVCDPDTACWTSLPRTAAAVQSVGEEPLVTVLELRGKYPITLRTRPKACGIPYRVKCEVASFSKTAAVPQNQA